MNRLDFVEREFLKRDLDMNWSGDPEDDGLPHADEGDPDGDYGTEDEAESPKEKKSPERVAKEKRFKELYEELMHPSGPRSAYREQAMLEDLYTLLLDLNRGWAYSKANAYRPAFPAVDEDLALVTGCSEAFLKLKSDKEQGKYIPYALAHYLRVAQNISLDKYFYKKFGKAYKDPVTGERKYSKNTRDPDRQIPHVLNLEGLMTDSEGEFHDDRLLDAACDPFAETNLPDWQRDDISRRIALVYLKCLLDYDDEPQKALALMYGSILFQMAKQSAWDDPLSQKARGAKVSASAKWALLRMGDSPLLALGVDSERTVSRYYGIKLRWGPCFVRKMGEFPDAASDKRWGEIVYTQTYGMDETTGWIGSIKDSMTSKTARLIYDRQELKEYILDTFDSSSKLRKNVEKYEKEADK